MASDIGFSVSCNIRATVAPPIPQAAQWAQKFTPTSSVPLLDMSQGVPGILPPPSFFESLTEVSRCADSVKYGSIAGDLLLRSALVSEMKVVYGKQIDVEADDISLTSGRNMAFLAAIMSLCDPGDEVILPVPWYFNHQMSLTMLGIQPIPLMTSPEDGFVPFVQLCSTLITERTKAIALVTPNNPTGAIYPPSVLASFAQLAKERGIALILDETYRDFITSGPPHNLFDLHAENGSSWRSHIIHLFSFSKSYCIPGHRLGTIIASPTLQQHIRTVLDSMQICAPRPVQLALAPLLPSFRPFIRSTAEALKARHDLFKACLPQPWSIGAQGGYFAFVRHPFQGIGAKEVCKTLAEQWGIVLLPAEFFGSSVSGHGDQWVRFAVANVSDENVQMVCGRLKEHLAATKWNTVG
ncbi:hypothetical protein EW146_g3975 [Bondarzewia mesenterica]|uniref:Aminotransferase class I/classII large domain-containing protein n=1 Tax=Bondarzewia mesenterica TaxID=1095465 RepID=A0A4V3XFA0_9AGAM|nr:hypothetical protein EW146_g3975 [Bondarzewia mesenterica]